MLPLTQYTEQLPLFNAMNFNLNVYDAEHHDQRGRHERPVVPVRSRRRDAQCHRHSYIILGFPQGSAGTSGHEV